MSNPLPVLKPYVPRSVVQLRIQKNDIDRFKALAQKKQTKYQTMMKKFLMERLELEEEKEH